MNLIMCWDFLKLETKMAMNFVRTMLHKKKRKIIVVVVVIVALFSTYMLQQIRLLKGNILIHACSVFERISQFSNSG
jgi:uncharacterized membrane protein